MEQLLYARRWGNWNRIDFYCVMLLMYTIWQYVVIFTLAVVQKSLWIVWFFFVSWFCYKCIKIYTWKCLKQYVPIPCVLLISLNQNVSILSVNNIF